VTLYALSLKQPWAALLVHGRKTIEVRRWSTRRRGLLLIHASLIADERADAWKHVPAELESVARLNGGILGAGVLTGCLAYRTAKGFVADQVKHLNEPGWFRPPALFGLVFEKLTPLPFHPTSGWMKFFPVEDVSADTLPEELRALVESTPPEGEE
jgi:hypothetical protein